MPATLPEDRRETILARLEALLKAIAVDEGGDGLRNVPEAPDTPRPLIVLFDGDEAASETARGAIRGRPALAPTLVSMQPQIALLDKDRPDAEIGPALNRLRWRVICAVLSDPELIALCHDGEIAFNGVDTELGIGRAILGAAGVAFSMKYLMRPAAPAPAP